MSTSTFRRRSLPAADDRRAPATKSAAIASPSGKPSAAADEPGEHGERPGEVAAEVERVREQRVAPVAAVPARSETTVRDASIAITSATAANVHHVASTSNSTAADEPRDGERRRSARLIATIRNAPPRARRGSAPSRARTGGPDRPAAPRPRLRRTSAAPQPRSAAGVRGLGEQAEAPAREPGRELDRDQQARGPDRHERGAPLGRHGDGSVVYGAALSSARAGLPELRARERGRRALLLGLRHGARARFARARGAQGRHLPLLRPRRLHGPRGADGPGGRAPPPPAVPRARPLRARALRGHGREVHRRRGDGGLRRSGRSRGRPGARRARGARRFAISSPRKASSRCGSGSRPARRWWRSARGRRPARAWRRATSSTPRPACRPRRRRTRILVDETTYRATERAIDYGEPRSIEAKGKAEPISVWEALKARARVVGRAGRRRSARRPRAGGHTPSRDARPRDPRARSRSSSRSSACRGSARAGSSSSSSRRSRPATTGSSTGATAARCPTARA